jgi:hypothetical protein
MLIVFIILCVIFYFGTSGSEKPWGCLGSIIRAALVMVLVLILIALGIVPWFF